jgi:hypothetical protein
MIGKRLPVPPAMSPSRIDMNRGWHIVLIELLVVAENICGRYRFVIIT